MQVLVRHTHTVAGLTRQTRLKAHNCQVKAQPGLANTCDGVDLTHSRDLSRKQRYADLYHIWCSLPPVGHCSQLPLDTP